MRADDDGRTARLDPRAAGRSTTWAAAAECPQTLDDAVTIQIFNPPAPQPLRGSAARYKAGNSDNRPHSLPFKPRSARTRSTAKPLPLAVTPPTFHRRPRAAHVCPQGHSRPPSGSQPEAQPPPNAPRTPSPALAHISRACESIHVLKRSAPRPSATTENLPPNSPCLEIQGLFLLTPTGLPVPTATPSEDRTSNPLRFPNDKSREPSGW